MAKIHVVLQGKGGVGKSYIASILAQYKINKSQKPLCIDTDSVNATFASYKALNVQRFPIINDSSDPSNLDALIEKIGQSNDDVIIDSGANSCVQMARYLISNQMKVSLAERGHQLVVHTIITGGQTLLDTISGFSRLVSQLSDDTLIVVWLNPYWGPVEDGGKTFQQMKAYTENKDRIAAIVPIPQLNAATFGRDLSDMLIDRLTFDEAIASPARFIITRQRLKMIRDGLFAQIDNAVVLQ